MRIIIVKDYDEMSKKAAMMVASQVVLKPNSVLGLATGSTPLGLYKELINLYNNSLVDFKEVTTFNLDEYYGLDPQNEQSYHYYMMDNLFNHINVRKDSINIPEGVSEDVEKVGREYDEKIKNHGGIDLQILGIGANGHIGFNEPNSYFEGETHLVSLDEKTIEANSRFFNSV